MTGNQWQAGIFGVDEVVSGINGYTDGTFWNGWDCPVFELDQAQLALQQLGVQSWNYTVETDTITYVMGESDPEPYEIKGEDIAVNGKQVHVYRVGTQAWCWEEEPPF